MPITIRKGSTVQVISTATDSWKLAALAPLRLAVLPDGIEHHRRRPPMKMTVQMISSIQCSSCCASAILVTGWMQVELVDRRAARQVVDGVRRRCDPGAGPHTRMTQH
jgi:hypothetical protein